MTQRPNLNRQNSANRDLQLEDIRERIAASKSPTERVALAREARALRETKTIKRTKL